MSIRNFISTDDNNIISAHLPFIVILIFILFAQLINASAAMAGQICWIQKVLSSSDGVDIYFSSQRLVTVINDKGAHRFIVDNLLQKNLKNHKYYDFIPFIHARVGTKIFSSNGPEDSCSIEVILKSGSIGIETTSYLHLPGLSASDYSKFIPAE